MAYFLGIDIGTSSARAVLFTESGYQKCISSHEYHMHTSIDGMAEIEPDAMLNATLKVIANCIKDSKIDKGMLEGMGISCHMHSLMAIDKNAQPLTRVITWADTRAKREAAFIEENYDVHELYTRTGSRVQHPMYPLSKILWIKKNFPHVFDKACKFITFKEYLIYKLYGQFLVDHTLAASQGFYNIHSQSWDEDILRDILGINKDVLSQVVECTYQLRGMKAEFANSLGLDRDTPMVIGSGDGIMANIGCGVYDDTSLSSTIGTSGAIRTSVRKPLLDPTQQTWCYSFTKDMWVIGGAINSGGIVLRWFRDQFKEIFQAEDKANKIGFYKMMDNYAAEIPPGSEDLIFLPYLVGERSPDWNADARGLMFGLGYSHGFKHIIRAGMEGVIYRMYSVYQVMMNLGIDSGQIKANGGYTKSNIWTQIQADLFNKPIQITGVGEASALGAAYIAMISLGAVQDMKQLLPGMRPQSIINPIEENHAVYLRTFNLAKQIYENVYK